MTRGGYRENAARFSRKSPIARATVYKSDYEKLQAYANGFKIKIPVVELLHRVINHANFSNTIQEIESNISERWHEQDL